MPKRLIIACDGTWLDSDGGFKRTSWLPWNTAGRLQLPSNITRLCRALKPESVDGVPQIVYYQAGLGSANNAYSYFVGGYLGSGISENIREAYAFLVNNYQPGDEIFLTGFSRGAFTARSIGGLIGAVGLLTKKGMSYFYPIFKDWENQNNPSYKSPWTIDVWPDRPHFKDANYVKKLGDLGLSRLFIPIHTIAVFDTVGSLGIPQLGPRRSSSHKEYSFINTEIPPHLSHAFQALALDERRSPFSPTLWEMPRVPMNPKDYHLQQLKQCWFPGVHSNTGGSYPDTGLADLTLAWMMEQLSSFLAFDPEYVIEQQSLNAKTFNKSWACGKIYDTTSGFINWLAGLGTRTPGAYCRTDPDTGARTDVRLRQTHEFIHPSVRVRVAAGGPGVEDKGKYAPEALNGWKQYAPGEAYEGKTNPWSRDFDDVWKWVDTKSENGEVVWIAEELMGGTELALMQNWPEVTAKGAARRA